MTKFKQASVLFFLISVFSIKNLLAGSMAYPDFRIIESTQQSMILEWVPGNFNIDTLITDSGTWHSVSFDQGDYGMTPGSPDLPQRRITVGIPVSGYATVEIMHLESSTFQGINMIPVPRIYKDSRGINVHDRNYKGESYKSNQAFPDEIIQLQEPAKFRDSDIQNISIVPFRYQAAQNSLTFINKIRLKIVYHGSVNLLGSASGRSAIDAVYDQLLINFDIARNWRQAVVKKLGKAAVMPTGPFYRMTVEADGLYKITASTLTNAGINISGLSTASIQMFNNGGHTLNYRTDSSENNHPFTQEIPILVFDQNQNGLFDSDDYLLFYGKSLNSWFYSSGSNDFRYQNHPYAKVNYYWLSASGTNGLRMEQQVLTDQPNAVESSFYYERFHFEEDKYNLLASGPDWYGFRFFGKSAGYTNNFSIDPVTTAGAIPFFRIQLKGGSGIKYGDDLDPDYRYEFTVLVNNFILLNKVGFTKQSRRSYETIITDQSWLKSGNNTLSVQYSGNYDGCNAYLDWYEFYYPKNFSVTENQLNFYTHITNQPVRYKLSNFTQTSGIYAFDVTDPVSPKLILNNTVPQGGEVQFDLPASAKTQNILVSNLTSAKIRPITSLTKFTPSDNLLSSLNQADFLIITDKSFLPYAEEISELRQHLTSKTVSTEDIFFYFNSGVSDPTAIRNFIRYAYYNWSGAQPSFVLLFGDGHYDYRNISLSDSNRVIPFEIYNDHEIDSRTSDNYYVDVNYASNDRFDYITPDLAIGRLPVETHTDAERMIEKLKNYERDMERDGWQTVATFVADDELTTQSTGEWIHQSQTENLATLPELSRFNIKKVYLSAYPSVPGGLYRIKPQANQAIIDYMNQGTLLINYVGHGSPEVWAHEDVFNMGRDLNRINNEDRLTFLIAATCDFGKYDDPHEPSFSEALIWKKNSGAIGVLASTRLVYSGQNAAFNERFYKFLFPNSQPSVELGIAKLLATYSGVNDQKYHLFADPTMKLADPRENIQITTITPDTLKALSKIEVTGNILKNNQINSGFDGDAVLIVNDARYDSVTTGGGLYYTLGGPLLFKGEVSVNKGSFTGQFIVPKSIRYQKKPTGRITVYASDGTTMNTAIGYNDTLLINGSSSNISDDKGPFIDLYFKDQENFSSGDLVAQNPVLLAKLEDDNGINMTGQVGHNISLQIDAENPRDISGFFVYEKDSYKKGIITYPLSSLKPGTHELKITAFDNLNNPSDENIHFDIAESAQLTITDVINYPNPFRGETDFTFQTNLSGADVKIKIYTISGRIIQEINGNLTVPGYNQISWDGRDRDGDELANGVYLYKIILKYDGSTKEVIEKMVVLK
ncbi:MAG: type IX secretion system sortase PorU [Calditrichaceae bacterium]